MADFETARKAPMTTSTVDSQNLTSNYITVMKQLLDIDRRITIREIHDTVARIVVSAQYTALCTKMTRMWARWIPKIGNVAMLQLLSDSKGR
jgi:hypothetical protein